MGELNVVAVIYGYSSENENNIYTKLTKRLVMSL